MTINDLKTEAAKHNATVENDSSGKWCVYQCCTPKGYVWACADIHMLKVEWLRGDSAYKQSAIADALERMRCGTTSCDNEECDYCVASDA